MSSREQWRSLTGSSSTQMFTSLKVPGSPMAPYWHVAWATRLLKGDSTNSPVVTRDSSGDISTHEKINETTFINGAFAVRGRDGSSWVQGSQTTRPASIRDYSP